MSIEFAERKCDVNGKWDTNGKNPDGWTNYRPCYLPELLNIIKILNQTGEGDVRFLYFIHIYFNAVENCKSKSQKKN